MEKCAASIDVKTNREEIFDVMKCIGIIAVIIGHLTSLGQDFIFSWHMPLFFIIAGYFYHKKEVTTMCKKDGKNLLLPYTITCLIIVACYALLSIYQGQNHVTKWIIASLYANGSYYHTSKYLADVHVIGAIWFLWALFWCRNIFNILYIYINKHLTLSCFVISIVAVIIDNYIINLPLAILPGLSALLFYVIGWKIKQNGGFSKINSILVLFSIVAWFISFIFSEMSMVRCFYAHYPINVIGAYGGVYTIWYISEYLIKYNCLLPYFIWIGQNSLPFLCIHLIELNCPTRAILNIPYQFAIPYNIILCITGTFALSKIPYTKYIFNIRDLQRKRTI